MQFTIKTPTKAFISNYTPSELEKLKEELTYTNTSAAFLLKRHYQNTWFKQKNKEGWESRAKELKSNVKSTLVFEEDGQLFVRPGSIPYLSLANTENVLNTIKYPKLKKIPWHKPLAFNLYDYQEQSSENLIEVKHGNVELCTASGKSAIILKILREMGLSAAIVTPSKSIFNEILENCERHFGKGKIGTFGDGKKKLDKLFTVCIGDSLVNIKPDTPEYEFFSNLDVLIVDESHLLPAETLEETCHGVLGKIPYRFFLSGTQVRGDGTEPLLQSIIGKTVHTLPTKEAKDKGYICNHDFLIIETKSSNPNLSTRDALEEKRVHFLNNKNIASIVAKFCNIQGGIGKQVLVLVEELSQISLLVKSLKVPFAYAHAESKKDRLLELNLEKVNPAESVEMFNKNEVKVLIGTSCIATGTNIFPMAYTVNWVGGASEIKTCQGAVGRSVRKGEANPWSSLCLPKTKCTIIDFDVIDNNTLSRHLKDRIEYYEKSGSEIKKVKL